tara:strand:+ start:407 stop:2083 length:1677 start_codon:yes stop_codon:yes gene_type:complete
MKKFKPTKIVPKEKQTYGITKTTTKKTRMLTLDDRLPSKQYIKSKLDDRIQDVVFSDDWDGVTDKAPSVNSVYDKINSLGATSDVWTREDASSDARVRSNKTGNYGFGNSTDLAFTEITHKLTLDGDLRVGAIDGSNKDIYLDDGVQLYKYDASSSTSMLTLHSSNGHKSPMNFAIGSSNPTVPLEINKAEGSALNLNDGTGLFQIGADGAANIGMNATKIQARDGSGSGSTLNINAAGGDVNLSNSSGTVTVENNLVVDGNLTVSGTATSVNTETITLDDNIIVLNNNESGTPSANAGIEVERGTAANRSLRWNESTDKWQIQTGDSTYADIATGGGSVEGTVASGASVSGTNTGDVTLTVGSGVPTGAISLTNQAVTFSDKFIYNEGTGNEMGVDGGADGKLAIFGTTGSSGTNALTLKGGNSAASNPALTITGHMEADTKSFNIPHPIDPKRRLVYGALEGPEYGVYNRGTVTLDTVPERIRISLPDYWPKLCGDDYTISITPYGPYNIWVDIKKDDGFTLECDAEEDVKFDWIVTGGRKDAIIPEVEPLWHKKE